MAVNIYYITLFPSLSHPISLHDRRRMFYTQYLLLRSFSHWVSCAGSGQVHWTRWLLLLLFLSSSFLFAFTFHTNTRYCFFQPNRPTQNEKCIYCCFFKRKSLNCGSVCIILYIDANAWFDCRFQWNQHEKKVFELPMLATHILNTCILLSTAAYTYICACMPFISSDWLRPLLMSVYVTYLNFEVKQN